MAEKFSLKDDLFNERTVSYLAGLFAPVLDQFDPVAFTNDIISEFPQLELKQRISFIAQSLEAVLPDDFNAAADVIERALPAPLDPSKTDDDFGHFIFAPLGEYVAVHGIEHPPRALACLEQITMRFSAEYAIRSFINAHPDQTFDVFQAWARSPNYHVRRLVSEGTRPKLPWGVGITTDYTRAMPLLDQLHADPTRFVTRSVANHLNDISKFDPVLVIQTLQGWQEKGAQNAKELNWMTRHALRGLIKQGHPDALHLLGYRPDAPVHVTRFTLDRETCAIGDALTMTLDANADTDAPVIIDYVMYFRKKNGALSPKVHKWKDVVIKSSKAISLSKTHRFKGNATTFTLYSGMQAVAVQINGVEKARLEFELIDPA